MTAQRTTTIGKRQAAQSKISASKVIQNKKKFYHISNVNRCTSESIIEHLKLVDVEVLSCYPALKKSYAQALANNDQSTSFRLCVDKKFASIVESADAWPEHVRVREWLFNTNLVDSNNKSIINNDNGNNDGINNGGSNKGSNNSNNNKSIDVNSHLMNNKSIVFNSKPFDANNKPLDDITNSIDKSEDNIVQMNTKMNTNTTDNHE
ncbi:hypothetical protein HELRODRAFT_176071 [Helobdella robusta]|uniref:Uncharacterized protein n=1 Tax=Helobdella robusta TaxID=6412 RepID=T1FA39_HELRO|nr:hypothetical protein HELRODRAFT_176071 [Helobdella robusta]ESO00228.1 hypothetical protein HELRODRAFT_176071 [Helobdella robusta]